MADPNSLGSVFDYLGPAFATCRASIELCRDGIALRVRGFSERHSCLTGKVQQLALNTWSDKLRTSERHLVSGALQVGAGASGLLGLANPKAFGANLSSILLMTFSSQLLSVWYAKKELDEALIYLHDLDPKVRTFSARKCAQEAFNLLSSLSYMLALASESIGCPWALFTVLGAIGFMTGAISSLYYFLTSVSIQPLALLGREMDIGLTGLTGLHSKNIEKSKATLSLPPFASPKNPSPSSTISKHVVYTQFIPK